MWVGPRTTRPAGLTRGRRLRRTGVLSGQVNGVRDDINRLARVLADVLGPQKSREMRCRDRDDVSARAGFTHERQVGRQFRVEGVGVRGDEVGVVHVDDEFETGACPFPQLPEGTDG